MRIGILASKPARLLESGTMVRPALLKLETERNADCQRALSNGEEGEHLPEHEEHSDGVDAHDDDDDATEQADYAADSVAAESVPDEHAVGDAEALADDCQ